MSKAVLAFPAVFRKSVLIRDSAAACLRDVSQPEFANIKLKKRRPNLLRENNLGATLGKNNDDSLSTTWGIPGQLSPSGSVSMFNGAGHLQRLVASTCSACRRRLHRQVTPTVVRPRHPAFDELQTSLASLPEFLTRAGDVRVIYDPKEYYNTILYRIANAKRRIFIASLYVGKEETKLIETLHDALSKNPKLELTILLDCLRATRETPNPSSASLVATLCAAFPKQVRFRLYHTPNLSGWKKKLVPRRFDEGWGLQHIKCYGVDDDVLISGANLSNDYFTNRQDRYIEFLSNPPLANFFCSLLDKISEYSFHVVAQDTSTKSPVFNMLWPTTNSAPSVLDPKTSITDFKSSASQALKSLTTTWNEKSTSARSSHMPPNQKNPTYDTTLRPVLQMGPFGIAQETELVIPAIFRTANSLATAPGGANTTLDWTSGYFSVQDAYKERVLDSRTLVRLVAASPEANGFYNSRGVSKYIPPAYTYLTKMFYDEVTRRAAVHRTEPTVEIREWKRPGWTYHAKGIWLTPAHSSQSRRPLDTSPLTDPNDRDEALNEDYPITPLLTLVGSSNYGRRSAERDLEANVLISTFSSVLSRDLQDEVAQIRQYAVDKVDDDLFKRKERHVPWGVKIAARAIEDKL